MFVCLLRLNLINFKLTSVCEAENSEFKLCATNDNQHLTNLWTACGSVITTKLQVLMLWVKQVKY